METTINIKLDEKQLEEAVKKVTEKLKENKDDYYELLDKVSEELKTNVRMYLEVNTSGVNSRLIRVYWGLVYNTFDSRSASVFDLDDEFDSEEVEKLKKQGWKEEVFVSERI